MIWQVFFSALWKQNKTFSIKQILLRNKARLNFWFCNNSLQQYGWKTFSSKKLHNEEKKEYAPWRSNHICFMSSYKWTRIESNLLYITSKGTRKSTMTRAGQERMGIRQDSPWLERAGKWKDMVEARKWWEDSERIEINRVIQWKWREKIRRQTQDRTGIGKLTEIKGRLKHIVRTKTEANLSH